MFENKTVVVTGGARGIGLGFTKLFAAEGARIYVCDISYKDLNVICDNAKGKEVIKGCKVDITKENEVDIFFKTIENETGGVDILVNNAGISITKLIDEMPLDEWDRVIEVNLKGAFLCTQYALRQMKKKGWGRIINMTSPAGKTGGARVLGQGAYAASKAALIGLTKTTAREGAKYGITVNGISPGFVLTELNKGFPEDEKRSLLELIPAGRFGNIEEVVKLGRFLASDDAEYITGQVIHINGGMWMFE